MELAPENPAFREQVLETIAQRDGRATSRWVPRRPMPDSDAWFETAWAAFRQGTIYNQYPPRHARPTWEAEPPGEPHRSGERTRVRLGGSLAPTLVRTRRPCASTDTLGFRLIIV